jgi:hypothetical protein
MKDNVLKKQFVEKDVQRLRNIITGKHGNKTVQSIGYTKATEFHKEGDVWTELGREWTIKDGIKQNITKLDKAKELAMPMFCPSCKKVMKSNNDKLFWNNYRRCFNCHVDFEHELRMNGLWDEWKKSMVNNAVDDFITNYKAWAEDMLTASNQGFVSEAGEVQNWKGGVNKELAHKGIQDTIEYLESLKQQ